jgi:hypothetical protein
MENSYNQTSEGIFLATEPFISDIAPHRELLKVLPYKYSLIVNSDVELIHIYRKDLSSTNITSWDQVLKDFLKYASAFS